MIESLPADRGDYRYTLLERDHIEALRQFRNAQIDVLRQAELIDEDQQVRWFEEVVEPAHGEEQPPQILISILAGGEFVGYGGLTNLHWTNRRAEVSFLMDPERAADGPTYERDMTEFLAFLAELAFDVLGLNRLFAETWAFRESHIALLEKAGFLYEGRMREHTFDPSGPIDSVLHGLLARDRRPA